ncbi:MAG TPA: efflux RND transporter periplasmic adaptor subunit [Treponema sp.]|nr:efflux RND transporter periplasmic adaptor subunit [Treponema sp.]
MIVVILYACVASKSGGSGRKGQSTEKTTFSVKTQTAEVAVLHDYVEANGDISAVNSVAVYPDIGGKIASTEVTLGSPVRKGDVIVKVDPSEPGSNYALSPVYAPISGSIISTPLKIGTTVTTSSTITTIGDIASLQITADIPERYAAALKKGLKAEITVVAYPDVIFPATVTYVSPVVDSTSRTKEIILAFDKNDSRINAGMFGKVKLYTYDYAGYVTVSSDVVVTKSGKQYLYVVKDDGTVEQREIQEGSSVDGVVQVLSGINPGEKIVVEGEQSLSDGSLIKDITNNENTAASAADETSETGNETNSGSN